MGTTRAGLRKRGASVPAPHPPHHVNDMQGGPKATLRGATADWDVVYSTFAAGACVTIGALAYIAYWQRVPAILRSVCWLQASIHSYCSALTCVRPLRLGLGVVSLPNCMTFSACCSRMNVCFGNRSRANV